MSAYDFDSNEIGKQLTPGLLRRYKYLSWLAVMVKPMQWIRDNFFTWYCESTEATSAVTGSWSSVYTYNIDDRVLWSDKRGYVCLQNGCLNIQPTGSVNSSDYWLEFTPNYVALNERVYNKCQIIMFVRAMNSYFRTGMFKIYIDNTGGGTFTIYVPVGKYLILGSTNTERDKAILDYAKKYFAAGCVTVTVASY